MYVPMNLGRRWLSSLAVTAALFSQSALAAPIAYKLDPSKSTLQFVFNQAGAKNDGKFGKYDVSFTPESNVLNVVVQVSSLDTGDKDRDSTLRSADLFNVAKFPQAKFSATKITHGAGDKYEAVGKLTIRDASRDVKIPLTFKTASEGGKQVGTMTGEVVIKRLDYGVGQGEWKSTEWVDNEVTVKFSLKLAAP
jgi:polyisoprenoid-binding protein YceI